MRMQEQKVRKLTFACRHLVWRIFRDADLGRLVTKDPSYPDRNPVWNQDPMPSGFEKGSAILD
jgi:hypothetical protein